MKEPSRVRVTGPLEPFAGGFVAVLEEAGYRPAAAAVQLRLLAHLSEWLGREGLGPADLREPEVERFRREHVVRYASLRGLAVSMAPLLGYLRELRVAPTAEQVPLTVAEELLDRYRRYLIVERGLTPGTVRGYVDLVRPFVESRANRSGELDLWSCLPRGTCSGSCWRRLSSDRGSRRSCWFDDIDWRAGEIVVRGKGARLERLPLPARCRRGARRVSASRSPGRLRPDGVSSSCAPRVGLSSAAVSSVVVRACERAGIGPVSAHALRHTSPQSCCIAARRCRRSGRCCATRALRRPRSTPKSTARRSRGWRCPGLEVSHERASPIG